MSGIAGRAVRVDNPFAEFACGVEVRQFSAMDNRQFDASGLPGLQ